MALLSVKGARGFVLQAKISTRRTVVVGSTHLLLFSENVWPIWVTWNTTSRQFEHADNTSCGSNSRPGTFFRGTRGSLFCAPRIPSANGCQLRASGHGPYCPEMTSTWVKKYMPNTTSTTSCSENQNSRSVRDRIRSTLTFNATLCALSLGNEFSFLLSKRG